MTAWCRQFRSEDATACSGIICANIEADRSLPPGLLRSLCARMMPDRIEERASLYYIAVCEDTLGVVGVGGLDLNEIRLLAVTPEHQRRGFGRLLLEHLESMVPPVLFGEIFVYSAPVAEGFYLACGYVSGGEHIMEVDGYPIPTTFMTKSLGRSGLLDRASAVVL
ncbi:MAG: GNAT family N-acetyltransferase [Acidobacteria bacterium]|nr:GNAT family N-acetyltransferase [Acidobacteriota bacterium]